MRRSAAVILAAVGALALMAPTASAAPLYSIDITEPASSSTLTEYVTVHVDVSGIEKPSNAAYEVNSGTWSESSKIGMTKQSSGDFESGFDSEGYANGSYKILVRAWNNGIISYDPDDPSTYAPDSVSVKISNAPPTPSGVAAYGGEDSVSVEWYSVATADRSDFTGYRVYRADSSQGSCPSLDAYELQETTFSTAHSESGLAPGTYCFTVTSTRSSPTSGTVESAPSPSVTANAGPGGSPSPTPSGSGSPSPGGSPGPGASPSPSIPPGPFIRYGRAPAARAPDAPKVPQVAGGGGDVDGGYESSLPYGPQQVNQPLAGAAEGGGRSGLVASGTDSRRQAKLMLAWGFLLVGVALLLRSFLFSRAAPVEAAATDGTMVESPAASEDIDQRDEGKGKSLLKSAEELADEMD